jgi:hypothetical protein
VSGHDFSGAGRATESCWDLSIAVLFSITCNHQAAEDEIYTGHLRAGGAGRFRNYLQGFENKYSGGGGIN